MRPIDEFMRVCGYSQHPPVSAPVPVDFAPTHRPVADALTKAAVLADLVQEELAQPPEAIRNAAAALQDALAFLRSPEWAAGNKPAGGGA